MLLQIAQRGGVALIELVDGDLRVDCLGLRDLELLLVQGARGRAEGDAGLCDAVCAHREQGVHHLGRKHGILSHVRDGQKIRPMGLHLETLRDSLKKAGFVRRRIERRAEGGLPDDIADESIRQQQLIEEVGLLRGGGLQDRLARIVGARYRQLRGRAKHPDRGLRFERGLVLDERSGEARTPDQSDDREKQPPVAPSGRQVLAHRCRP